MAYSIMLASCSMLYPAYYAKNYAGIMGAGLTGAQSVLSVSTIHSVWDLGLTIDEILNFMNTLYL